MPSQYKAASKDSQSHEEVLQAERAKWPVDPLWHPGCGREAHPSQPNVSTMVSDLESDNAALEAALQRSRDCMEKEVARNLTLQEDIGRLRVRVPALSHRRVGPVGGAGGGGFAVRR